MADYYQLLGVPREADDRTIKDAYRKLALRYHPDRNPGDAEAEEKFKEINEAYAVLSDPQKRARFDRFGSVEGGAAFNGDIFDVFASVFGAGFGGRRQAQQGMPGEDLEAEMSISLEQAREGASVPLQVDRLGVCGHCHGSRAEPGGRGKQRCADCGGAGVRRVQAQSFFGTVVTTQTCGSCMGSGELVLDPCTVCHGEGRVHQSSTVQVNLPKGIDGGYRLRIPREGNAGLDGAQAGDLYLYLQMQPHEHLRRDGDDLRFDLRIGLAQAALGSSFEVPTLDGPEAVEVPAGTRSGSELRLRGKGMPRLRHGGTGDQLVTVVVDTPQRLSAKARELLQAYADEVGEEIVQRETLVERFKGLFHRRRRGSKDEEGEGSAPPPPAA